MNYIKLFEDFSEKKNSEPIINQILDSLKGDIDYLVSKHEEEFQKLYERPMNAYDKEIARLSTIFDMVKAIEIYTLPNDVLINISSSISPKGNLEISARIERDGRIYPFSTEVIYAGGHNIQRLHYRYITRTTLPKTGNKEVSSEYSDKIKNLSRLEKINLEIQKYEDRIQKNQEDLEANRLKTQDQIWDEIRAKDDYKEWPSWSEIVRRGADKNYGYSETLYNQKREESLKYDFDFWNNKNIKWKERDIKSYQGEIEKLRRKLEKLM